MSVPEQPKSIIYYLQADLLLNKAQKPSKNRGSTPQTDANPKSTTKPKNLPTREIGSKESHQQIDMVPKDTPTQR
nr:TPA_asm: hypothetical protein HUJ06_000347 [Nelumbo nucifera]